MKFDRAGITVDCDVETVDVLAEFWSAAMGYVKLLPTLIVDPEGVQPARRVSCGPRTQDSKESVASRSLRRSP